MNKSGIKEAVDQIQISSAMQEDIIRNVKERTGEKKGKAAGSLKKTALSAAAALLVVGVIAIPVQAGIRRLVRERMESIPEEEMKEITRNMEEQNVEAGSYSRGYSEEEEERMAELFRAYQKGTFPTGELQQIDDPQQIGEDAVYYLWKDGCFYLPDREMTDEEILQIIDFEYKRNYSLEQADAVREIREETEKEQAKQRAKVEASGGITEESAVAKAKEWMNSWFGISTDGMEENIYLDEDYLGNPAYHVCYSIRSDSYYYFSVSTVDGRFEYIMHSGKEDLEENREIAESQIMDRIRTGLRIARSFLEEQMGISENYEEIYCIYRVKDGMVQGKNLEFYFITEEGTTYWLALYRETGELRWYYETGREHYQQTLERQYEDGLEVKSVSLKELS